MILCKEKIQGWEFDNYVSSLKNTGLSGTNFGGQYISFHWVNFCGEDKLLYVALFFCLTVGFSRLEVLLILKKIFIFQATHCTFIDYSLRDTLLLNASVRVFVTQE